MNLDSTMLSAVDVSWVPAGYKLFLVFDFDTQMWSVAVRLRHDHLGFLATADSTTMGEALSKVRKKVREKGVEVA